MGDALLARAAEIVDDNAKRQAGGTVERAFGLEIPENPVEACDRRKLALLVYDVQVGILRQLEEGAAVTAGVLGVLEAALGAGARVFFLRHLSLGPWRQRRMRSDG